MKSILWLSLLVVFQFLSLGAFAFPAAVVPPYQDPFYSAPGGYESSAPGTILKWRVTPHPLRSIFFTVNVKNSWQLLVRSTDSHGNPTVVATTVIEPYNADNGKLVSYQIAEDASTSKCAPSYSIQFGAPEFSTIVAQAEMFLIQTVLNKGYWVVTADYEGPNSAFTAGRLAGQATLDSIRATLKTGNFTGLNSDAKTAIWGYSGGSFASGWATALQPKYAPELSKNLIGTAVGGFVTNITTTVELVEGSLFAGLTFAGINGLSHEYPEIAPLIKDQISPFKYRDFLYGGQGCVAETVIHFALHRVFTGPFRYIKAGWDILRNPVIKSVLDANTLGISNNGEIPQIPVFIYHGKIDEIVSFPEAVRTYNNWCSWGAPSIEFAVDNTAGHIDEVLFGSPAAITWIEKRFNGEPAVKGCQRTDRLNNWLYPGTDQGLIQVINAFWKSIFQFPIGPNGEKLSLASLQSFTQKFNGQNVTIS